MRSPHWILIALLGVHAPGLVQGGTDAKLAGARDGSAISVSVATSRAPAAAATMKGGEKMGVVPGSKSPVKGAVPGAQSTVKGAAPRAKSPAAAKRDPRAAAIAEKVVKAVDPGGEWGKVAGLRFTYGATLGVKPASNFKHTWDLKSSRYRVEGIDNDGNEKIAMFQLGTAEGEGWVRLRFAEIAVREHSAEPVVQDPPWLHPPAPLQARYVEFGYERFRNDTAQLLLPLRMKEPGVGVQYDGMREIEGLKYEVVKVTLPALGLIPEETYWVFVNPATHLIDRTEYLLHEDDKLAPHEGEDNLPAGPRVTWIWTDWQKHGPFLLSAERKTTDGKGWMRFKEVSVLDSIPAAAWEKPPLAKTRVVNPTGG